MTKNASDTGELITWYEEEIFLLRTALNDIVNTLESKEGSPKQEAIELAQTGLRSSIFSPSLF